MSGEILVAYGLGFLTAVVIGHGCISAVMNELWRPLGSDVDRTFAEHPQMVGVVERFLYAVAWILGQSGFVAVWLTLKVAGQWKGWSDGKRSLFNVFLIGNGLSICFGVFGGQVPNLFLTGRPHLVFVGLFVLVFGSLALRSWATTIKPATV